MLTVSGCNAFRANRGNTHWLHWCTCLVVSLLISVSEVAVYVGLAITWMGDCVTEMVTLSFCME